MSLDGVLQDVRALERGMEGTKKEFMVQDDITVLKEFVKVNSALLDSLVKDGKTAQVRTHTRLSHTHLYILYSSVLLMYKLIYSGVPHPVH